jgi:hypothetical protein
LENTKREIAKWLAARQSSVHSRAPEAGYRYI